MFSHSFFQIRKGGKEKIRHHKEKDGKQYREACNFLKAFMRNIVALGAHLSPNVQGLSDLPFLFLVGAVPRGRGLDKQDPRQHLNLTSNISPSNEGC